MRRLAIAITLLCTLLPARAAPAAQLCARPIAAGTNTASVVVEFADGAVERYCVGFDASERLTGIDLLQRTGLPLVLGGTKDAASVCRIGRDGCNKPGGLECWCECKNASSPGCKFWGYYQLREGAWTFASRGASDRIVKDGDVDGWRFANHVDGKTSPQSVPPCKQRATRAVLPSAPKPPMVAMAAAMLLAAAFGIGGWRAIRRRGEP